MHLGGVAAGRQKALEHAEKKGWTNIVHVWSGEGEFDAPVAKSFAIDAIPVSILFDQHGHVAWRGHPGEVDLAALVTNLLRTPPSPTHAFKGQSPSQKWIHGGDILDPHWSQGGCSWVRPGCCKGCPRLFPDASRVW